MSTPPMGEMNFLVRVNTGSVGMLKRSQNPLLTLMFGYQVKISLIRNAKVNMARPNPRRKWIIGSAFNSNGVTKL